VRMLFGATLISSFLVQVTLAEEIKLEKSDLDLLRTIDKMEKGAGTVKGALFFAGISTVLTDSMIELTYNVGQLDLAGLAGGMKNIEYIKCRSIDDAITIYLLDEPPTKTFWEKLKATYSKACP
jgi:hypothetical protein